MTASLLQRMTAAQSALIAALDGGEVEAIERSVCDLAAAVAQVRNVAGWHVTPDLQNEVRHALKLVDAAAIRTNFLADQARRRLDMLTAARGSSPRIGYTRTAQGAA